MKLHAKRAMTCFPLKDTVVVLGQGQSGLARQVRARGGVLKITVFGTPGGYRNFSESSALQ